MTQEPITLEELLAEIQQAELSSGARDGWTTYELADTWCVSHEVARRKLREAFRRGWARCVGRRYEYGISGSKYPVPIYKIDVAKTAKRKAAAKRGRK